MSTNFWDIVRRIHRNVELALCAALFAFVIFLTVFVFPKWPEIHAQSARIRAQEISDENVGLCDKLNINRGTDRHDKCLLDVGQFRWKVERRAYDEIAPW